MKSNAIMRIVIWSIVTVLLVWLLAAGLLGASYKQSISTIIENIRTGGELTLEEVPMSPLPSETAAKINPYEVTDLEIEWVAGKITIFPADVSAITVSESDVDDEKYALLWQVKNGKLSIQYCQDINFDFPSFGVSTDIQSKDLTIQIPRDWACNSLEVDAASATLEVRDLTIREVEIDTASGRCGFESCTVGDLDLDTASGDVVFTGSLNTLACDAASASVAAVLTNHPTRMELDTMSGNLDITLPSGCGFSVSVDGLKSDFSTDFDTVTRNGRHIHGDGGCKISVSAVSGNVTIHKGE